MLFIKGASPGTALGATIAIVLIFVAAGVATFLWGRKKKEKARRETEETAMMGEVVAGPQRVPLSSLLDGDVVLPTVEQFKKLAVFEDSLGSRQTTAQGAAG